MGKLQKIVISLRLDISPGREQLTGIFRYMKKNGVKWDIQLRSHEKLLNDEGRDTILHADGLIASESQVASCVAEIENTSIPVVLIDAPKRFLPNRDSNIVLINLDNAAIGRMGARHFLSRGRPNAFAFVTDKENRPWARQRAEAFARNVRKLGFDCAYFDGQEKEALSAWLGHQQPPVAIMTACDRRLDFVQEACRANQLDIPNQVQLLGVDNDEQYCTHTNPSISSIEPGLENEGMMAADALDKMMKSSKPSPRKTILLAPQRICIRESTSKVLPATTLISKALAFIDGNVRKPIDVNDVVMALNVSRRLVDLRFRQLLNKSVSEIIAEKRIKLVLKRIEDHKCPTSELVLSCGFKNRRQLERLFRKATGRSIHKQKK